MFISVVPSVWHILVRVCYDEEFLPCFRLESTDRPPTPMATVSDGGKFHDCANFTSCMPSIVFDAHTLCIGCKDQVCNMSVYCYECRPGRTHIDWCFSNNRTLKARRDSEVRRKARLGAAQSQSDQSVCNTDTDVPSINEPIPSVQVQSVRCPRLPPRTLAYRTFLYVTVLNNLRPRYFVKCVSYIVGGFTSPVQSQPVLGSGSQPLVATTDQLGVSIPPEGVNLPNFIHPFSRLSTVPVSDETPLHRLAASDHQLRDLETKLATTHQAIDSFCDGGLEPPHSLVDSLSSLSRELVDARRFSS